MLLGSDTRLVFQQLTRSIVIVTSSFDGLSHFNSLVCPPYSIHSSSPPASLGAAAICLLVGVATAVAAATAAERHVQFTRSSLPAGWQRTGAPAASAPVTFHVALPSANVDEMFAILAKIRHAGPRFFFYLCPFIFT